jgi:hypothetical protein
MSTEDVFTFVTADVSVDGTAALPEWWSTGNGDGTVTQFTGSGWQYEFQVRPARCTRASPNALLGQEGPGRAERIAKKASQKTG